MKNVTLSGGMPKRNVIVNFFVANRNTIIEIISALFILLFVYTAISKLITVRDLKIVLRNYPLLNEVSVFIAWALPILELIIALLIFIPRTKLIGLFSFLFLMTMFTFYVAYLLVSSSKLPCTCGGLLQKLNWPEHLIFNILCIVLALITIKLFRIRNY